MSFSQTKTRQGFLPFRNVMLVDADGHPCSPEGDGAGNFGASLVFDLLTSREVMQLRDAPAPPADAHLAPQMACDITHLGLCTPFTRQGDLHAVEQLVEFARKSGPLFGTASGIESLRAWRCAADAAMLAVLIQEVVNGSRSVKELDVTHRVNKLHLTNMATGQSLVVLDLNVLLHEGYEEVVADLPFVRRVEQDGGVAYVFAHRRMGDDGRPMATLTALRLPEEISASELTWLVNILGFDANLIELSRRQLIIEDAPEQTVISNDDAYESEQGVPLEQDDVLLLSSLVQALIVMHLKSARIDVFQGDGITGYLTFDSLLSWMWYDFSSKLEYVSFAYCMQCGRPFALTGHRGIARKYCSSACKTRAKNERVRKEHEAVREQFMDGRSVVEIAHDIYKDQDSEHAEQIIRDNLSSWPHLKHEIEQSISDLGFQRSPLLNRCVREGLDVGHLLSVRRLDELKKLGNELGADRCG